MRIRTTLFLIFGIVSGVVFYVGILNFVAFENQFSNISDSFLISDELGEFYENFRTTSLIVLISTGIIAVGVIIATVYLSRQLVQPIERLEESMRNFENLNKQSDNLEVDTNILEYKELFKNYEKMVKKVEHNLELEKNLVEQYKVTDRQKNEFVAMISHELKSPLVPISGYLYLLKNQKLGSLNEKQLDAINTISSSSKRLDKLIGDILIAQKLEMKKITYKKTQIKLPEFVDRILDYFKITEKKCKFVNSVKENLMVFSDPDRLTQVLTNLIKNAVDFVPDKTGVIEIGAFSDEKNIVFFVKDNGSGISEEHQSLLFRKFYQIDTSFTRQHGGSGLGLAICKGLIEGLGGTIWVKSKLGKGSTFFFTLPNIDKKNSLQSTIEQKTSTKEIK